jgi:hypothetical protein
VPGHEVRQVYDIDPSTCNHCIGNWAQDYFSEAFFLEFGSGTLPLPVQEYNPQPNLRYNADRSMTKLNIGWKTNSYASKKTNFDVEMLSMTERPPNGFVGRWVNNGEEVLNPTEEFRRYSSFHTVAFNNPNPPSSRLYDVAGEND